MPKKANLDLGFLLLYDWLPAIYELPAKEVKALLIALIERQRESKPLPIFKNKMTNSFALMIEPVIQRRLDGQAGGKKGHEKSEAPTLPPCPPREEENERIGEQDNVRLFERRRGEILSALSPTSSAPNEKENGFSPDSPPSPGAAEKEKREKQEPSEEGAAHSVFSLREADEASDVRPIPCAQTMLSDAERSALLEKGVRSAYINERIARAAEWAERTKKSVYAVLLEWWQKDKDEVRYRNRSPSPPSESSFDADEVFAMMVARTYQNETRSEGSPTNA